MQGFIPVVRFLRDSLIRVICLCHLHKLESSYKRLAKQSMEPKTRLRNLMRNFKPRRQVEVTKKYRFLNRERVGEMAGVMYPRT